ncbi:septation protein SepH [Actinomadura atramentaria]|uniref:septation protein SepH n=1 Tax=Actinomadura atramentaria TaxID=1990 RepID=UPI000372E26C|nr:septation protein SepH [Actinomadura atramentaria]
MQELRLVAVSEDGTYLVLATAGRGTRFTLPVDDRLRAAVRGHFSRLGQFEIEVESPLRPKEIQARIRSGETAEEIAESAGIPVERIRWFEGPVLQEREYMAQQAQRVAVRRPGDSAPGPALGETVEERLARGGVDLDEAEWDSWKCEDSTWRVRLSFFEGGRPHAAEWVFDPRRRHVSPLDEVAARLTAVEWDDDSGDTVTPLVPRRPTMTVVSDARGLPEFRVEARGETRVETRGEPRVEAPAEVDAGEAGEFIVDHGRMVDARPAFRELPEAAEDEADAEADADADEAPDEISAEDAPEPEAAPPVEDAADEAEDAEETAAEPAAEAPEPEPEAAPEPEPEPEPEAAVEPEPAPEAEAEAEAEEEPEPEPKPAPKPAPRRAPAAGTVPAPAPAPEPVRAEPSLPEEPPRVPAPARPQHARPAQKKKPTTRPSMPAASDKPVAAAAADTPAQRAARGRRKSKGKRASVPSWDEIMFGARRPE